ncbi:MAG: hypothetical protein H7X99_11680 [Saprospiraceae bacterium]|nr:hypothetical protein [Saprospiraceae bacterium]
MMTDKANWQSVVLWGTFQELKDEEAGKAREYLFNHVLPIMTSSTIHPNQHAVTAEIDDDNRHKPVMYQILVTEKTGRFEKK